MGTIQLDLFAGIDKESPAAHVFLDGICPRDINNSTLYSDPCNGCPLRGLCDADECGMKCYEIDQATEPKGDFEEWLSDPIF